MASARGFSVYSGHCDLVPKSHSQAQVSSYLMRRHLPQVSTLFPVIPCLEGKGPHPRRSPASPGLCSRRRKIRRVTCDLFPAQEAQRDVVTREMGHIEKCVIIHP